MKTSDASVNPVGEMDLHLFNEGTHRHLHHCLGAHPDPTGTWFAVWAPNAASVDVLGDFDGWRGQPLQPIGSSGIWSAHVPGALTGQSYRYAITTHSGERMEKSDPVGAAANAPPSTASIIAALDHEWGDAEWMAGAATASLPTRRSRSTRSTSVRGAHRHARPALPDVRGAGRPARRPRPRPRVHPRRAAADHGAPVLRIVGLPDDGLLRPDGALRDAAGADGDDRPPAPARRRRHPRLGAVALPDGRPRTGPLRRHPPVRARRPPPGVPPGLDVGDLQLRPPRGPLVPALERRCAGSTATTSTGCASTPSPRCSTSTTPASRASGSPTASAVARTSRRSTSCVS